MTQWTPEQHRTPHAAVAFAEAVAGYARSHGLLGSVTAHGHHGMTVTLRAHPDALFDLTRAALHRGDAPADFHDPQAPTDPGSIHHTWAQATAQAYNRHHLTGRLPQYRQDLLKLATDFSIDTVHVSTHSVDTAVVLHQLLGIKHP